MTASSVVESSKRSDTSRLIVEPRSFALDEFSIDDGSHFRMYGKKLKKREIHLQFVLDIVSR